MCKEVFPGIPKVPKENIHQDVFFLSYFNLIYTLQILLVSLLLIAQR